MADDNGAHTTDPLSETTRLALRKLASAEGPTQPQLVVIEGTKVGSMLTLADVPITIGREPSNYLSLTTVGVSRRHAVVGLSGDVVTIEDLGSKNGTFVNRERITKRVLEDGDLIFIGAATIKFLSAENAERGYYDHLLEVSARDPLTDLPNRRYFDDFLEREIARYTPATGGLSLLVIDVDHFKNTNDRWGHLAGDTILKELAAVMSHGLRRSDFLARYGGEEFALVLPHTCASDAHVIAEKVRARVADFRFSYQGEHIPITISIGGASWAEGMESEPALIRAADEQLYKAKAAGRNQVCVLDSRSE